jgi:hypothetical protein
MANEYFIQEQDRLGLESNLNSSSDLDVIIPTSQQVTIYILLWSASVVFYSQLIRGKEQSDTNTCKL